MGVRGELFSTRVILQNRTYFFNVKENRIGDLYLNIVESKNRDEGGFERQSVILFAEDLQEFLQGFDESLRVMEKAVREKRKSTPGRSSRPPAPPRQDESSAMQTEHNPRKRSDVRSGAFKKRPEYSRQTDGEMQRGFSPPRAGKSGPVRKSEGKGNYGGADGRHGPYRKKEADRDHAGNRQDDRKGNSGGRKRVVVKKPFSRD